MTENGSDVADPQRTAVEDRAVIEKLYAAANGGDTAAIPELLDAECLFVQAEGHPVPGTWQGREAVIEGIVGAFEEMQVTGVTVHEIVADGTGRVIGLVDILGVAGDGEPYAMPLAETFRIREGKIAEIRPFYWDLLALRRLIAARDSY